MIAQKKIGEKSKDQAEEGYEFERIPVCTGTDRGACLLYRLRQLCDRSQQFFTERRKLGVCSGHQRKARRFPQKNIIEGLRPRSEFGGKKLWLHQHGSLFLFAASLARQSHFWLWPKKERRRKKRMKMILSDLILSHSRKNEVIALSQQWPLNIK